MVGVGLTALLIVVLECGYQWGVRAKAGGDAASSGQIGAIQGALLGLLGLFLAFTFAAAAARFLERQDLITTEANAIGTATLRADLLAEPHRMALRTALADYTRHRLGVSLHLRGGVLPADLAEAERLQARIWSAAVAGINDRPQAMLGVLPPVNDVIDLHSSRLAAGRKRIPVLIMAVLMASSLLAMGVIGYGSGIGGRRRSALTISLALVVGASLWITYDLDHPRAGILQLNDAPLRALRFDEATP
jgi:hypothetical protein